MRAGNRVGTAWLAEMDRAYQQPDRRVRVTGRWPTAGAWGVGWRECYRQPGGPGVLVTCRPSGWTDWVEIWAAGRMVAREGDACGTPLPKLAPHRLAVAAARLARRWARARRRSG